METAKVDVRRLQILNDRINQMLEVLQQMRLSMHALQHVPDERALYGGVTPFPGYGYGQPNQFGQPNLYGQPNVYGQLNPFFGQPNLYGQSMYSQVGVPYGTTPWSTPIPQWGAPIYARPYWTGYEGDVTARFADARFVDARFAPNGQQIPFSQNLPSAQNIPFSQNGQVPFSHSPTAAFG